MLNSPHEGHTSLLEFRTDATQPKMTRTPEGYLRGDAVVSRTGVFEYTNADGSTRYELRHPDDVFNADSLATLQQIPVTLEHPPMMLDATNAKRYQVGHTGDRVDTKSEGHIVVGFTITDSSAVNAVDTGRMKQLSLGYRLDLKEEAGTYQGKAYTHRQTNIRYNHLALVPEARAGAVATINMDGMLHFSYNTEEPNTLTTPDPKPRLEPIRLDGIAYEGSPEVVKHIAKLETANADAGKSLDEMKKQLDAAKGKYDALKAEFDEMKKGEGNKDSLVAEAVTARLALITSARKLTANTDGMEAMGSRDIMVRAIQAKATDFNADGKSDEYVQGRFDTLLEMAATSQHVPASIAGQRGDAKVVEPEPVANFDSYLAKAKA